MNFMKKKESEKFIGKKFESGSFCVEVKRPYSSNNEWTMVELDKFLEDL